jgi:hypothetical protein
MEYVEFSARPLCGGVSSSSIPQEGGYRAGAPRAPADGPSRAFASSRLLDLHIYSNAVDGSRLLGDWRSVTQSSCASAGLMGVGIFKHLLSVVADTPFYRRSPEGPECDRCPPALHDRVGYTAATLSTRRRTCAVVVSCAWRGAVATMGFLLQGEMVGEC